jgi:hypothetical protein
MWREIGDSLRNNPAPISAHHHASTSEVSGTAALVARPPRRISSMPTSHDRPEYRKTDSIFKDDVNEESTKLEVEFAKYSSIHVYPTHECERRKSYKSPDIKKFKTQIGIDVLRVEELITTCPHKRGNAVCHLIDSGALAPEELIGIDHLLGGEDAARKIAFDRFAHVKLVTRKQVELHEYELAAVASKKSSKNVDKALMRARLAELQPKQKGIIDMERTMQRKMRRDRGAR